MASKLYRVRPSGWRPALSIGTKTLLSFFLIITLLAGGSYLYMTFALSSQIEREALGDLYSKLKGSWKLYYERMDQMKLGMLQAGSEEGIVRIIEKKDSRSLKDILSGYSSNRPYVDFWAVVDADRTAIGRKNGHTGDFVEINGVVERAIKSGEAVTSTEIVTKDLLSRESAELAAKADSTGLMQVAVVPVFSKGEVVGAFVTGILVNRYGWLPESIYENYHVNSAVLTAAPQAGRAGSVVTSTDLPKSIFNPLFNFPEETLASVGAGKKFLGGVSNDGDGVYLAVEPVFNIEGKVIGALSVGAHASEVKRHISSMEDNIFVLALVGAALSLFLAILVYRDTSKPINAIVAAMSDTAEGNLDVRLDIGSKDELEKIGEGFNRMVDSIRLREQRLDRFNEISKILIEFSDPAQLLDKSLSRMVELTGSSIGAVYLVDENGAALKPAAAYGVGEDELKKLGIGEGIAGKCASEMKTVHLENITDPELSLEAGFFRIRPTSLVWFPMLYKGKLSGVLVIGSLKPYYLDEIKHIERLIAQIAIALDNALVHKEMEKLSFTDPLTGAFNRRHFFELLEAEFSGARRYRYNLAVFMIDIDDFKFINDTYGHQQGDKVLMAISQTLRDRTRATDVWARYGGEEFVGFVAHGTREGAVMLAEKLRKCIEEIEVPGMDGRRITASIGIGYYPFEGVKDLDDLIKTADENLYLAKRNGKNRVMAKSLWPEDIKVIEGKQA